MCKGPRTYCFGTGREAFGKTVVNPENAGPDKGNPGPGEYQPQHPLGTEAVGFKLKHKLNYGDDYHTALKKNIPAPGTYEDVLRLDGNGRYTSSEFNNSKSARWAKDDKLRLPPSTHYVVPGPGIYEHVGNVGQTIQSASQYHTVATRIFGKEQRPEWHCHDRFKTPGPGTYVPPSDFGYVTISPRDPIKLHSYGSKELTTPR